MVYRRCCSAPRAASASACTSPCGWSAQMAASDGPPFSILATIPGTTNRGSGISRVSPQTRPRVRTRRSGTTHHRCRNRIGSPLDRFARCAVAHRDLKLVLPRQRLEFDPPRFAACSVRSPAARRSSASVTVTCGAGRSPGLNRLGSVCRFLRMAPTSGARTVPIERGSLNAECLSAAWRRGKTQSPRGADGNGRYQDW
jgi:hypothetical protein